MHSQNREGTFANACSERCKLFSVRKRQSSNARHGIFQRWASASAFQRHTAFLTRLMSLSVEAASRLVPSGERVRKLECCSRSRHSGLPTLSRTKETSLR